MNNRPIHLQVLLSCILISPLLHSQSQPVSQSSETPRPPFSFKVEDVLSGNRPLQAISDLTQSPDGFMWLAGTGELIRYDGYNLVHYRTPISDVDEKFANWNMRVLVDRSGMIWTGMRGGGLKVFNPRTEQFTRYQASPGDPKKLSQPIVTALLEDRVGVLWIGTPACVNSLDRERKSFTQYAHDTSEAASECSHGVTSILEDRDGTLWIGTSAGLSRFERTLNRFVRYGSTKGSPLQLPSDTVLALCEDGNGFVWVGLRRGIVIFNPKTGHRHSYNIHLKWPESIRRWPIFSLAADIFGNIWVGTGGGGLEVFDPSTKQFIHFKHNPHDPATIKVNVVNRIYTEGKNTPDTSLATDPRQSVAVAWLVYPDVGISRITVRKNEFQNVSAERFRLNQNAPLPIWSLTPSYDKTIWAGSSQTEVMGLLNIDLRTNRFVRYVHNKDNVRSLAANRIKQIFEDRRHNLWIVAGGKLQRYERKTGQFKTMPIPEVVSSIGESRDSSIWFSTLDRNGFALIGKFNPATQTNISYPRPRESAVAPQDGFVYPLYEDSRGLVWMGTFNGGLYSFDERARAYRRFLSSAEDSTSLRINTITSFVEDPTGALWIGTHVGLHRFDLTTLRFEYIQHPNYPPTNLSWFFIRDMVYDGQGSIWIASDPALSRFNIQQRAFRDFGVNDGLTIKRFGVIRFDSVERVMYLGGFNGLASFHPNALRESAHTPKIVLTEFKIHENPVSLPMPLLFTKKIEISYKDNFFSFTFAALDFANPAGNSYAYMMEGFDRDWIYTGTRRYASYTNLEPGTYLFRVKGANSDGVWNESGTAVQIVITPPWYRSTRAYLLYGILLACSLFALERLYRRRLTLRHETQMKDFESQKLREMDQMKSRFFANISHEFRTPLTLILGPIDRIKSALREPELNEDLEVMRRSGQRLLQLINRLLDLSKSDAGQMPLYAKPTEVVQFLRSLVGTFTSHAERKGVSLKFESSDQPIEAFVDHEKLAEIIANLLSNAFKFTPRGGHVTVSVSASTNTLPSESHLRPPGSVQIAVRDTGIGMQADKLCKIFDRFYQADSASAQEQAGTGIGLALAKELVELHHGSISVGSIPNEGSTFTVELPLGRQHLRPDQIIEEDRGAPAEQIVHRSLEVDTRNAEAFTPFIQPEESSDKHPSILVIEDNADVRRYLRSILEEDYQVDEAAHGKAGLAIALESLPDLIVSDIMMPEMDGIEVCKRLKADERTSHIPIILLTARATIESKIGGLELGADDYITKPFEAQELRARIRNLIGIRLTLREKYRKVFMLGAVDQQVSSVDEQFLRRVVNAIEKHLSEPGYETATLAYELCMSRMNLNRKLHALTGHSTHDFIRTLRLHRAAQLLRRRSGNVSEVAYEVGFSSVSHFAKAFHEQFGETPSECLEPGKLAPPPPWLDKRK